MSWRRKFRFAAIFAGLLASGFSGAGDSARAQARLVVQNDGALSAYLSGLQSARLHLDGACEILRTALGNGGLSGAITLSLSGETPEIIGLERLGAGEQILARTALRVIQALARLGLTAPEGAYILRIEKAGLYVGNARRGGRIFADPCAGLGHLLKLIIDASGQAPESLRSAAAGSSGASALFEKLRAQADILAVVSRGSRQTARIEGTSGLGRATEFSGTPGIAVLGITRRSDQSIILTLEIDPAAEPGDGAVYAYRPADRFTPLTRFAVRIIDRPAPPPPPRAAPPPLAPGSSITDRVEFGAGERSFSVAVERPGTLVIESSGTTDLAAGLFDPAGKPLGSNDDGGARYNFRIAQPVEPGQYRLDVSHCCGGAGAFGLTVRLE